MSRIDDLERRMNALEEEVFRNASPVDHRMYGGRPGYWDSVDGLPEGPYGYGSQDR